MRTAYLEELGDNEIEWLPDALRRIDLTHPDGHTDSRFALVSEHSSV